ncbi:type II secretion system F family protein [Nocardia camponoti]|uniref:Type II secretion system protein F n=1 Tax=Nocardia camponoti TaxID=1616106 RepID=A0A917VBS4_9NOCA|nr:type II secretion system F family protein [Nocardia camponoti]GGK60667.1 type II secretion system protein F [Nocardia camponoti]
MKPPSLDSLTPLTVALLVAALLLFPARVELRRRMRLFARTDTAARTDADERVDPLAAASTFDLLAACLRAGLPMASAANACAASAPGPLSVALTRAADLLALGADGVDAWDSAAAGAVGGAGADEIEALARMARRSARSGASLAEAVAELAATRRDAVEDAAVARAERAGVLIGGPLGLCFLPAFVCLGIVPVVIGLADHVLGDGGLL